MYLFNNASFWKWVLFLITFSAYKISSSKPIKTYKNHELCLKSQDRMIKQSVKDSSIFEVMEPNSKHGDICRNSKTGGYFCPLGCSKIRMEPFCKEKINVNVVRPCRLSKFEIPKSDNLITNHKSTQSLVNKTEHIKKSTKNGDHKKELNKVDNSTNSTNSTEGLLSRAPMSARNKDWVFGFGAEMIRAADNNVSGTETVKCDFTPLLLPLKNKCSNKIISQRNSMYMKKVDENRLNALKDVTFTPLYGENIQLRIGGRDKYMNWVNDDKIYSAAWNETHAIRGIHHIDPNAESILAWRELTYEQRLNCSNCTFLKRQLGPVYVVANSFPGHYGRFLHDTLALIFWLRKFRIPENAYFAIIVHSVHRKLIQWLDLKLYSRIIWIHPGITYCFIEKKFPLIAVQVAKVDADGSIYAVKKAKATYLNHWGLSSALGMEIGKLKHNKESSSRSILFYSPSKESKPIIDKEQEDRVFETIAKSMKLHNRKEKLIRYSPSSSSSYEVLFAYFRQAEIVIGPKGSGLVNMVWMQRAKSCEKRKVLLEFTCTKTSKGVCGDGIPYSSAWDLAGGAPWLSYKHLLISTSNSSSSSPVVDTKELSKALDSIF